MEQIMAMLFWQSMLFAVISSVIIGPSKRVAIYIDKTYLAKQQPVLRYIAVDLASWFFKVVFCLAQCVKPLSLISATIAFLLWGVARVNGY